jgi:hypothetical protein
MRGEGKGEGEKRFMHSSMHVQLAEWMLGSKLLISQIYHLEILGIS